MNQELDALDMRVAALKAIKEFSPRQRDEFLSKNLCVDDQIGEVVELCVALRRSLFANED